MFATLQAGPGRLSLDAGFQLDNSASSVDNVDMLSLQDRVSLGVSSFNEAFGGLHYAIPFASNKGYLGLEGSLEAFVGSGSPGQIFRGTLTSGYRRRARRGRCSLRSSSPRRCPRLTCGRRRPRTTRSR